MKYDIEGVCQDCIYLEKIRPLFEEKDKEIKRLCNALNEVIERNSKAIEYVENNVIQIKLNEVGTVTTVSERFDKDEFLDILQGVDK